jgi:hypothetical protein
MSINTKYKEDIADPQLNISSLNKEFDINIQTTNFTEQINEINKMRKDLNDIESTLPDVDQIIYDNIDRANRLLDNIEIDINKGNTNARLLEVTGQLINAVTVAATSITGIGYNQQIIDSKNRALDIKEQEVAVKSAVLGAKEVNITNNNLTMSREDLLKMIKD